MAFRSYVPPCQKPGGQCDKASCQNPDKDQCNESKVNGESDNLTFWLNQASKDFSELQKIAEKVQSDLAHIELLKESMEVRA